MIDMQHKILITGSNGLLGQKLVKLFVNKNIQFLATSKGENRNSDCPDNCFKSLDVTNESEIKHCVSTFHPTAIIHTAAMTNVDQCEEDHEGCDRLNIQSVSYLWSAAKAIGAHFQLLSTDFVFDGEKGNYNEEDVPNPISYYGNSKLKAEQVLMNDSSDNWSIARAIIVYGTGHNLSRSNLILWAMSALPKGNQMNVVNDQFRAPTWADDLAMGCWLIIEKQHRGVFHLSGPETKSILEWVLTIGQYFNWSTENVHPISSQTLNQPAKRPPKTGFDLTKAQKVLGYKPKKLIATLDELRKEANL